ncbi:MAG: SpoIIE family protein phosphatase [Phycisphaeraceae bacterium]|nr:SpoIIE family protein phosphatase [Phycisphaeraceae bacterium]
MSAPEDISDQLETAAVLRLLELSRHLAAPDNLQTLLQRVIDTAREVLHADRATVFLYDDKTRELFTYVAHGVKGLRFSIDKGIAGECARTRAIVNVPDCYADPRFNPQFDRDTGYRTRCLITVPLMGLEDELVGVLQLLNSNKESFDVGDERMSEALAGQAAVAIQRARLMEDRLEKLKLQRDLALARQIQMNVLPRELPKVEGYDLAGFSQPAEETGGDIYDILTCREDDNPPIMMLMADATGHGVGPAISVTQVRAMMRVAVRTNASLDDLLLHINRQVCDDLDGSRFVTAFFGVLDPVNHRVTYHSAGQGPLLHYHATQRRCEWLDASTLPLGIMADMPIDAVQPFDLERGDALVLLTDGFYEYQNEAGQQLGKDRIGAVVDRCRDEDAQSLLQALLTEVRSFANGAKQLDDLTAVIVKRRA